MKKIQPIVMMLVLVITVLAGAFWTKEAQAYRTFSRSGYHYSRNIGHRHYSRYNRRYVRHGYHCVRGCRRMIYY